MEAGGSLVDALEAAPPPCDALPSSIPPPLPHSLPILPRIARTPKIDLATILWPLERAARTPRGRSTGRTIIAGVFLVVLVVFAGFNVRGPFDDESPPPAIPHPLTASVHGHRGLAGFRNLEVLSGVRSSALLPPPSALPRGPAGALSPR